MRRLTMISLIPLLAACYPQGPEYVEDTDVVYTVFNEEYDFAQQSTYAMPDEIVYDIDIEDGDTIVTFLPDKFADPIFETIEDNMTAAGYTRVEINDGPDLLLTPAVISSTTYFYSYWYDWWYGGWYGWGWGWYYPPYYTVSSYTTGSMIMVLSDPNMASDSPINRSPAVWVSTANGLVSYAYDITRITESINQSFKQSPYLSKN